MIGFLIAIGAISLTAKLGYDSFVYMPRIRQSLLEILDEDRPMTPSEAMDRVKAEKGIRVSFGTFHALVAELEQEGLIQRSPLQGVRGIDDVKYFYFKKGKNNACPTFNKI